MPQQETSAACSLTHLTSYHKGFQLQGMVKETSNEVAPRKASETDQVSVPGAKIAKPTHAPVRPSPLPEPLPQADEAGLLQRTFQAGQPRERIEILREEVSKVSA